jgi:hypothetical protein
VAAPALRLLQIGTKTIHFPFSISNFSFVVSEKYRSLFARDWKAQDALEPEKLPLVQAMTNEKYQMKNGKWVDSCSQC